MTRASANDADDADDADAALVVPEALDGSRADFAVASLLDVGKSAARRLLDAGRVRAAGRKLRKGDAVRAGDAVVVDAGAGGGGVAWFVLPAAHGDALTEPAPEPTTATTARAAASVTVLYEDADVVVVDKPTGMPCHPLVPGEGGTVADALVVRYPELVDAGEDAREAGLVHRLDTGTSGCLAFARTRAAWHALRAAFSGEVDVDKRYLALVSRASGARVADDAVHDHAPLLPARLTSPIAHDPRDRRRMLVGAQHAGARAATSDVRVLALARADEAQAAALVEVRLVGPGRRHQIRAHLAAAGWPLLGDSLYGGAVVEGDWPLLHALSLALPGRPRIDAKVPSLFAKVCAERGLALPEGAI